MSAKLIFYRKQLPSEAELIEMKIWQVPKSERFPEGIKYSLVYVREGRRVLGSDNSEGKSHHRHYGNRQHEYVFEGVDRLIDDFQGDVERCGGSKL